MDLNNTPDFKDKILEYAEDIAQLRQHRLLPEDHFISFARQRGVGVVMGDPSYLISQGFLDHDGDSTESAPLFHPFRIYPLQQLLRSTELQIAASVPLHGSEKTLEVVQLAMQPGLDLERLRVASQARNRVVDLAILLEPIFWPRIVGYVTHSIHLSDAEHVIMCKSYREKVLKVVRLLDPALWCTIHEKLRIAAAMLDENHELYLLLRLSDWKQRDKLRGAVSGALWLRHIAETIRLAFEEVHSVLWAEEDQAFGIWSKGARKVAFGSDRPLQDALRSRPYLGFRFGLFTGSLIRWYVEGDTEHDAVLEALSDPARFGIELVNLRGNISTEKDNIALKLSDSLNEDLKLRRFSMISFDLDVEQNVKAVRRQIALNRIVGLIAPHKPDFEFANFTLSELVEIAANIDEQELPGSGAALRNASWGDVANGRDFETRYKTLSARQPRSIKDKSWGRVLARFALENPHKRDTGEERPLLREIEAALRARTAHYDFQKEHFRFDTSTFELIDVRQDNAHPSQGLSDNQ